MTDKTTGTVSVNVVHDYTSDTLLLTIASDTDNQVLKFDFEGALRLQQRIFAVTSVMRGNKIACEAVGRVIDAEKKARENR